MATATITVTLLLATIFSPPTTEQWAGPTSELVALTEVRAESWVKSIRRIDAAVIQITFARPMRPESLSPKTVQVISEKQSRDVTASFRFVYSQEEQTLILYPVNPEFDFGTGNIVTVRVSSQVEDSAGRTMGKEVEWSFAT